MRRFFHLLVLCLLTCAASGVAQADATSDARKAIQAIYNKIDGAVARRDFKGAFASHAPDYYYIDAKGRKLTLAQLRRVTPRILDAMRTYKSKTTLQKLTLKGNTASVVSRDHTEATFVNPQTQKNARVVVDSVLHETWIKSKQGWLRKSARNVSSRQQLDGRVIRAR
jgi:ketosteroid isomerase-like protein